LRRPITGRISDGRRATAADYPVAADDGDELLLLDLRLRNCLAEAWTRRRCATCTSWSSTSGRCRPAHLFREGEPFEAIAAVREGTVKTYVVDREGREQVLGFHFPGEVIGLSAIENERYPCNAIALDTVALCRFSFSRMTVLASRLPGLQKQLFRLMSRDIGNATLLAGDHSADERLAAFLIVLSRRLTAVGLSGLRVRLMMPRTDIANYLRLAPETVSRVLRRLQDEGMIHVQGRELELTDRERVDSLASVILRS
jgi:CRP/FNR family transcriptional regulator